MATTMQDFISNYLAIDINQRDRRQAQIQEVTERAQQLTSLIALAEGITDPSTRRLLSTSFAGMLPEGFASILENTAPSVSALGRDMVESGLGGVNPQEVALSALTGMNRGQQAMSGYGADALANVPTDLVDVMRREFLARSLTGGSQGDAARSQAMAGLPPELLGAGAEVDIGVRPSADTRLSADVSMRGQDIQRELGFASNRLGWADLTQRGALAEAAQLIEAEKLELMRQAQMGQFDPAMLQLEYGPKLLEEARQLQNWIQSNRNNLPPAQLEVALRNLQNINDMMQMIGMYSVDFGQDFNANQIGGVHPSNRVWNWFVNPQPFDTRLPPQRAAPQVAPNPGYSPPEAPPEGTSAYEIWLRQRNAAENLLNYGGW